MKQVYGMKKALFGMALVVVGCLGASPALAAGYNITYFPTKGTQAFSINNAGEVVGMVQDATGYHGFIGNKTGSVLSTFDVPGATSTYAEFNNNNGVLGGHSTVGDVISGFLMYNYNSATPTFVTYNAPVANLQSTFLDYINDNGDFAGHYVDTVDAIHHPFVVTHPGGIETFVAMNGVSDGVGGFYATDLDAYNNLGTMGGHYDDGTSIYSFVTPANPANDINTGIVQIGLPGFIGTELEHLNTTGQAVGYVHDENDKYQAFFLADPEGSATMLFDPALWLHTWAEGINDQGEIVGYVFNGSDLTGFIATSAVPEPSTFLLTGAGIAALGFLARRRNRNS